MSEKLRDLLRREAASIDVPPPPVDSILAGVERRRRGADRRRSLLQVAATVAVVAGVLIGADRILADPGGRTPSPITSSPTASTTPAPVAVVVSGSKVDGQGFGTGMDEVLASVEARLGQPEVVVGPDRYSRNQDGTAWIEDAQDPLSPSWRHEFTSVRCWGTLCLVFGGDAADSLQLRGWELAQTRRWSGYEQLADLRSPDVRLAGTGIRLGDSWKRLHAAYPDTVGGGGEGASLTVRSTPWAGVSDGVGAWRLSGQWDPSRPEHVPAGAKVTRLSAGEGPEPGCC